MSIDDLLDDLEDISTNLSLLDTYLLEVGNDIALKMKANAPVDTGALRSSIRAEVSNNTLIFKMLAYGTYQNYGVSGKNDNKGKSVEFGIKTSGNNIFKFKNRRFGINAKNFFEQDIMVDEIVNKIVDKL